MNEYVRLIGAEEVSRAAYTMRDAASEMSRAANTIVESNDSLIRALREHGEIMLKVLESRHET